MPLKLKILVMTLLGSEGLALKWWDSPNKHFNKLSPRDCDTAEVYSYVLGFYK